MIEHFSKDKDYGTRTTGCSCCSLEIDPTTEEGIKRIKEEARDNIRVVKEICKAFKISFVSFCKDILIEDECEQHDFRLKYPDQLVCWKCGKWGEKIKQEAMGK